MVRDDGRVRGRGRHAGGVTLPEDALGPDDLRDWLQAHDVEARLHTALPRVHTVAEAAEAMGVGTDQVAKSVVCSHDGEPVVVLAPGDAKVDDRAVVDAIGGSRKRFRLARPDEVLAWTGYPVGAVPPLGYRDALPMLIEETLLDKDRVFFGGGADDALLEVAPVVVKDVTGARPGRYTR